MGEVGGRSPWWRQVRHIKRDTIIFTVGILGIANEALRNNVDRPALIVLFGGMIGLPVFLHTDEQRRKSRGGSDREEDEQS